MLGAGKLPADQGRLDMCDKMHHVIFAGSAMSAVGNARKRDANYRRRKTARQRKKVHSQQQ